MAKEKVKADSKELSVEQKLTALNNLQKVVSEIDRIKTLRGELPLEVQDLEDEIAGLQTRVDKYKAELEDLQRVIAGRKIEIDNSKALVAKYEEQRNNVKNNREYDFLSKEIDFQNLEQELSNKRMREAEAQMAQLKEVLDAATTQIEERAKDLELKKGELSEIIAETKHEEETLREHAKKIETQVEERLLAAFKRIRKNARNGLAVVPIERDACGGCYNKIPPQRQMDVKLRKKIIVCEFCGRIMIDPAIGEAAK